MRVSVKDDGSRLEWSRLSRALDATDDVMSARGHCLGSYSNEEYAAALREALRESVTVKSRTETNSARQHPAGGDDDPLR